MPSPNRLEDYDICTELAACEGREHETQLAIRSLADDEPNLLTDGR